MIWLQKCLYCNYPVYLLADGRLKCSKCYKKVSREKVNKVITLVQCYAQNKSALSVAKQLHLSYVSVQKYYETFRFLSAKISEEEYEKLHNIEYEYEEYFYLESSKKLKREAIFDAHNFLTFDYDGHIYTLLMPSLHMYKTQMIDEFKKFKRESKIIKISKRLNNIVNFWEYFEKSIVQYKGITDDRFAYFLKEFEFKYNHSKDDTIDLLIQAYFKV